MNLQLPLHKTSPSKNQCFKICNFKQTNLPFMYTVKSVNKGHPRERQHMVLIDNLRLLCFILSRKIIEVWPLYIGLSLFRGGL